MNESHLRVVLRRLGVHTEPGVSAAWWLSARCPFARWDHVGGHDRRPSFGARIDESGQSVFKCHACNRAGTIEKLALLLFWRGHEADYGTIHKNPSGSFMPGRYPDLAYQILALESGSGTGEPAPYVPVVPAIIDPVAVEGMFREAWRVRDARRYLKRRRISGRTAAGLGLLWDAEERRILFPVRGPSGQLHGFSGRAVDDDAEIKVRDMLGLKKRAVVLGAHLWRRDRSLLVVEGPFDLARLVELRVDRHFDIGALLGSAMSPEKAALCAEGRSRAVYLLLDNDAAGRAGIYGPENSPQRGAIAMLRRAGLADVRIPPWPSNRKDADEISAVELWRAIGSAVSA